MASSRPLHTGQRANRAGREVTCHPQGQAVAEGQSRGEHRPDDLKAGLCLFQPSSLMPGHSSDTRSHSTSLFSLAGEPSFSLLGSIFANCSFNFKIIWHTRRPPSRLFVCLGFCCLSCFAMLLLSRCTCWHMSRGLGHTLLSSTVCLPVEIPGDAHPAGACRMQRPHSACSSEEVSLFSMPDAPGCTLQSASCNTVLLLLLMLRPFNT